MTIENVPELQARYADGPRVLREAFNKVPAEIQQWRPAPGEWSVHEIICHCADSETYAAIRIRLLLTDPDPLIVGYDQERWATQFDYHNQSLDLAWTTIDAVRANTVALVNSVIPEQLTILGRHTESGTYGVEDWLDSYGNHLHIHADQIRANIAAWEQAGKPSSGGN